MIDFPFGIAFFLAVDHHRPLKIGHVWTFLHHGVIMRGLYSSVPCSRSTG